MLHDVAVIALVVAALCALIIVADLLAGNEQHMAIMNVVWPISALYAGPIALWAYFRVGRQRSKRVMAEAKRAGREPAQRPFWQSVALGTSHCGAGCTCGDLVAEWFVVLVPLTLFGERVFGTWALDYALAFLIGIVFQYLTIKPMRDLSPGRALVAALKADTLSLTAWQVGMYGFMAVVLFVIVGHELPKTDPRFWFAMQLAMIAGFLTSYPVNWWLVRRGIKERM